LPCSVCSHLIRAYHLKALHHPSRVAGCK
jgi:hypothetical protein